ncbi:hypothetical protein PV336_27350 [Streptomyces sp. MI02-2A]|uniref:hypothetical protein n=1 Tax=Streptomyces sp. MI02-2A TaxID=3028688 RepID=UPI0029BEECA8|nr:hypothetical protein [Streptomyces sp. MI02-2A]MDX3262900.1 hypothetical protein [Streptomyces sp. MI02-2A]
MRNLYERKRDHSSTSREQLPRTCAAQTSGRTARDRHGENKVTRAPQHRPRTASARIRIQACALALACGLVPLAGCSNSESTATPSQPSTSPTPQSATASTDPAETARKAAVATYEAYWREMEKLYADPAGTSANLGKYAASAALKNAEVDSKAIHDGGNVIVGDVKVTNPAVSGLQTAGETPHAIISSCLDITNWQTLKTATRKPVKLPHNRLTKYLINSTVEKWPEGWRVTRDEPQGKPC